MDPGACAQEKKQIQAIVQQQSVEIYKDNVLVMADLFRELYPDAKWVYVTRSFEECYKSRMQFKCDYLPLEDYVAVGESRAAVWKKSAPAKGCCTVDYNEYKTDLAGVVQRLGLYLGREIRPELAAEITASFKPR